MELGDITFYSSCVTEWNLLCCSLNLMFSGCALEPRGIERERAPSNWRQRATIPPRRGAKHINAQLWLLQRERHLKINNRGHCIIHHGWLCKWPKYDGDKWLYRLAKMANLGVSAKKTRTCHNTLARAPCARTCVLVGSTFFSQRSLSDVERQRTDSSSVVKVHSVDHPPRRSRPALFRLLVASAQHQGSSVWRTNAAPLPPKTIIYINRSPPPCPPPPPPKTSWISVPTCPGCVSHASSDTNLLSCAFCSTSSSLMLSASVRAENFSTRPSSPSSISQ